jgi:hypothetical protein
MEVDYHLLFLHNDVLNFIVLQCDYITIFKLHQTCKKFSNIESLILEKSKQNIENRSYILPYNDIQSLLLLLLSKQTLTRITDNDKLYAIRLLLNSNKPIGYGDTIAFSETSSDQFVPTKYCPLGSNYYSKYKTKKLLYCIFLTYKDKTYLYKYVLIRFAE